MYYDLLTLKNMELDTDISDVITIYIIRSDLRKYKSVVSYRLHSDVVTLHRKSLIVLCVLLSFF